jgi:hypothetical protein
MNVSKVGMTNSLGPLLFGKRTGAQNRFHSMVKNPLGVVWISVRRFFKVLSSSSAMILTLLQEYLKQKDLRFMVHF